MTDEERAREIAGPCARASVGNPRATCIDDARECDACTTAHLIDEALRSAREDEREKAAKVAECWDLGTPDGHRVAAAIRAGGSA